MASGCPTVAMNGHPDKTSARQEPVYLQIMAHQLISQEQDATFLDLTSSLQLIQELFLDKKNWRKLSINCRGHSRTSSGNRSFQEPKKKWNPGNITRAELRWRTGLCRSLWRGKQEENQWRERGRRKNMPRSRCLLSYSISVCLSLVSLLFSASQGWTDSLLMRVGGSMSIYISASRSLSLSLSLCASVLLSSSCLDWKGLG